MMNTRPFSPLHILYYRLEYRERVATGMLSDDQFNMDNRPLLEPGFHDYPLENLKESLAALCVKPFVSRRRELLLDSFIDFICGAESLGIFTEFWLDGSFLTDKESPNDIDLVLFFDSVAMCISSAPISLKISNTGRACLAFREMVSPKASFAFFFGGKYDQHRAFGGTH